LEKVDNSKLFQKSDDSFQPKINLHEAEFENIRKSQGVEKSERLRISNMESEI